jgi:hypothetical protein
VSELKIGDRVRVTTRNINQRYQPGDKGTVTGGPHTGASGTKYFRVSMDKGTYGEGAIFADYEIELDL